MEHSDQLSSLYFVNMEISSMKIAKISNKVHINNVIELSLPEDFLSKLSILSHCILNKYAVLRFSIQDVHTLSGNPSPSKIYNEMK